MRKNKLYAHMPKALHWKKSTSNFSNTNLNAQHYSIRLIDYLDISVPDTLDDYIASDGETEKYR